jgi:hypothetical protein
MSDHQRGYRNIWKSDMSDKIYVIPGTSIQGREYVKNRCAKRYADGETTGVAMHEYVIVNEGDITKLRGISNPHGVFVGTWRERKDLHDICIQLNVSHDFQNAAIQQIMKDELGY